MAKTPVRWSTTTQPPSLPSIKPCDYSHSPVHYTVALGDNNTLPHLSDVFQIRTDDDSFALESLADQISYVVDRRDVPFRENPLHLVVCFNNFVVCLNDLVVRLNEPVAAKALAEAGADVSLHNSANWNPLKKAMCSRHTEK